MSDQELAFLDAAFLESDEARPIRIMAEYLEPLRRFKAQNIQDTVVFFGSARIRSREKADDALGRLEQQLLKRSTSRGRAAGAPAAARPTQAQRLALTRARRAVTMSRYYEDARRLAHLLTEWSLSLGFEHHRFVVCSGGGPGIMEAANRGAFEAGGKSIGLNIKLPFEQGLNEYTTKGLGFQFHYFFMRKLWFAYLAKALVVFPGGFGTLDEMYEILTLAQTQKLSKKLAVVLYGPDYWNEVMDIEPMAKWGMISPDDLELPAAGEHAGGSLHDPPRLPRREPPGAGDHAGTEDARASPRRSRRLRLSASTTPARRRLTRMSLVGAFGEFDAPERADRAVSSSPHGCRRPSTWAAAPAAHAFDCAGRAHRVHLVDLVPRHIEISAAPADHACRR